MRLLFGQHMGFVFEDVAGDCVARRAAAGPLPFPPERVVDWWDGTEGINVLIVSDSQGPVLVAAREWSQQPIGPRGVAGLRRKAFLVADMRGPRIYLDLFGRREVRATAGELMVVGAAAMIAQT